MKKVEITPHLISQLKLYNENIKKEYYVDYYLEDYKADIMRVKNAEKIYVQNTIDMYCQCSSNFPRKKINDVMNALEIITKKDTLITFNEKSIFKELYKILHLIHVTQIILDFIKTPQYKKNSLVALKQDKREVKRDAKRFKKMIVGAKTKITYKKESRLKWYLRDLYARNKKLFDFVLSSVLLNDIVKVKTIYDLEVDELELILNELVFFTTQQTNANDIIKSLAILLHYELKEHLKIKDTKSKELVSEIIQYVFEKSFNDEEFNRNIYIRSSVGLLPIFGARKKEHKFNQKEISFIKKQFFKRDVDLKNNKSLDMDTFNIFLDSYKNNPHMIYLQKYPVELFRINPKYIHL